MRLFVVVRAVVDLGDFHNLDRLGGYGLDYGYGRGLYSLPVYLYQNFADPELHWVGGDFELGIHWVVVVNFQMGDDQHFLWKVQFC